MHDQLGRDVFQPLANIRVDDRHEFAATRAVALGFRHIDRLHFTRQVLGEPFRLAAPTTAVSDLFFDDVSIVFARRGRLGLLVEQPQLRIVFDVPLAASAVDVTFELFDLEVGVF